VCTTHLYIYIYIIYIYIYSHAYTFAFIQRARARDIRDRESASRVIHHRHRIRESAASPFVRDVYPCEEETDEGLQEVLGIMTALTASSVSSLDRVLDGHCKRGCSWCALHSTGDHSHARDLAISRECVNREHILVSTRILVSHVRCIQFVSLSLRDNLSPLGLVNKSSPHCDVSNILASPMSHGVGRSFVSRTILRIGYDDIAVNLKQ